MVTDLMKGELIVKRDQGDLPFAIRASCCIPFFMAPIQDDQGRLLIDGGIVQNLNDLIPAGSGYQIQNATALNDNGQIVANTTSNHTLLLTPS